MFHVYYTQKGTNLYFLNKTEYEVWMNVRELDFDMVINGESDAQIVLLYVTDKVEWDKDELKCDSKIYVFKSDFNPDPNIVLRGIKTACYEFDI